MTDAAKIVRAAFPHWKSDPYQKAAADVLLRILFAGENAQRELDVVETCLVAFIEDPPFSLSFDSPARQAEHLARRLEQLARALRKGAQIARELQPYIDQFNDSPSGDGGSHGGLRPQADGDQLAQAASDNGPPP